MWHQDDTTDLVHPFILLSEYWSPACHLEGLRRCVRRDPRPHKGFHQTHSDVLHERYEVHKSASISSHSVSPVADRGPQTLYRGAVVWKCLAHPNIVPLLGITISIVPLLGMTITPLQLISEWMPGGDLPEYIEKYPDANRLGLVGISLSC